MIVVEKGENLAGPLVRWSGGLNLTLAHDVPDSINETGGPVSR
jgi:hypothetical protein